MAVRMNVLPQARRVWVSPHNRTVLGDADRNGNLIPGRIWSGGRTVPTKSGIVSQAKQRFIEGLKTHGFNCRHPFAFRFRDNMSDGFWLWASTELAANSTKAFLESAPLSAYLKILEAETRKPTPPDPAEKSFTVERDTRRNLYVVVNRDYSGSLEETFRVFQSMGVELRFMRNFVLPANPGPTSSAYAISYLYPANTASRGEFNKLADQQPAEVSPFNQLKARVEKLLSGFLVVGSEAEISEIVKNYFQRTIPEIVAGQSPAEIAQQIQWYVELKRSGVRCQVIYDNSRDVTRADVDGPRLIVYLNTSYVTSQTAKVCGLIKENGYDIRQMSVECQENPLSRENLAIITFLLHKVDKGNKRKISPADGSILKEKIESAFQPILGKENIQNIVGPVMVGSSSSHTAGAARIGRYARRIIEGAVKMGWIKGEDLSLEVRMRNTFALHKTGGGHFSADAVVAGLMEAAGGPTEENVKVMHDAMKIADKNEKVVIIGGLKFSLDGAGRKETESGHNLYQLNIISEESPAGQPDKYYENQISIVVKDSKNNRPVFSVTLDSVGGGIIRLAKIRLMPNNNANGPLSHLYSQKSNYSMFAERPGYFAQLNADLIPPNKGGKIDPKAVADQLKKKIADQLKALGIEAQEELIGVIPESAAAFFVLSSPLSSAEKEAVVKSIGALEEITPIGLAPREDAKIPFSDFESLRQAIVGGQPIGEMKCANLAEAAIAYQHTVFGLPEEVTREYYRKVLKVMFGSIDRGLKNKAPLHQTTFNCPWAGCSAPLQDQAALPNEMGRSGTQVINQYTQLPLQSSQELFEVLDAVFRHNRPEAAKTFAVNRGAFSPQNGEKVSAQDKKNLETWNRVFANPIAYSVFMRYRNDLYVARSLRALEPTDNLIESFYGDLVHMWEHGPFRKNIFMLAMGYSLAVNEESAKRGLMVAAPTAGSCGVIPGVLRAINESYQMDGKPLFSEKQLIDSLLTAGLVGLLFNDKLRTSGGTGGCQAEMGAAIAMASAAAAQLMGGTLEQIYNAVAFSLKQVEGLTCTPIAGYVNSPCIKRNGMSAQIALGAAAMALAGAKSFISPDSMMASLAAVAMDMKEKYRETGEGGCADTDCGRAIIKKVGGE